VHVDHGLSPDGHALGIQGRDITRSMLPSWAVLSLPVPLSADAEGSLGIKPRRDVNAATHGGARLKIGVGKISSFSIFFTVKDRKTADFTNPSLV